MPYRTIHYLTTYAKPKNDIYSECYWEIAEDWILWTPASFNSNYVQQVKSFALMVSGPRKLTALHSLSFCTSETILSKMNEIRRGTKYWPRSFLQVLKKLGGPGVAAECGSCDNPHSFTITNYQNLGR